MSVATAPIFHSPEVAAAAAAADVHVCLPLPPLRRCINEQCESRGEGLFVSVDHGDGDVCTTCGTKQSYGGQLKLAKGIKERVDDDARALDAARTSQQAHASGVTRSADGLESRVQNADRRAIDEGLRAANRHAKLTAKLAAQQLHPNALEGVRSSAEMQQLRDWAKQVISNIHAHVPLMTSERDVKWNLARAEGNVMGESAEYIASLPAPKSYEQQVLEDGGGGVQPMDIGEPDSKRRRVDAASSASLPAPAATLDAAAISALIAATEQRINAYVRSEARLSKEAYAKHKQVMDATLAEMEVDVEHPTEGIVKMRGNEVQKKIVQRDYMQHVAGEAAAAAAADGEEAPSEYHVMQSLRKVRVVQDTLLPRLDALFKWMYLHFILFDGTDPTNTATVPNHISRDFTSNPACLSWFNRTLQFLVQYKSVLKAEQHQQMRNVELYAMHAIITASWATHFPMSWGIMDRALEAYQVVQAQHASDLQRRSEEFYQQRAAQQALAEGDQAAPAAAAAAAAASETKPRRKPPRVARKSTLNKQLFDFANAVGVKGDWAALVRAFATSYLSQLGHSRLYEDEVLEQVDKCVKDYAKHKPAAVLSQPFDELKAQIGLYEPSDDSEEEQQPAHRALWQFGAPIAAVACVRKVMQDKYLPYVESESKHYVVKSFKPQWAKKRARPSPAKHSCKLKAARFAQIAGVSPRDVTACLDLLLLLDA
jgi:hypothetical protein